MKYLSALPLLFAFTTLLSAEEKKPSLPKVILVGDSIRLAYAPLVAKKLQGKAIVVSPADNGIDSPNLLKKLDAWVIAEKPAIVHLNCGLHDLKLDQKTKKHQVGLEDYKANLKTLAERVKKETGAKFIFALTTPVDDARHVQRKLPFDRLEADVKLYNAAAREVLGPLGVELNDLHAVVNGPELPNLLGKDGVHFTDAGNEKLADAVAKTILRNLNTAK